MNASEEPISRVNYFNGQRLNADDFRADQDYQIAVRRKLYSALYSSGIVTGLEVTQTVASAQDPAAAHKVTVAPGVALDFLGREIILLEPVDVIAAGTATTNLAAIFGNYLVISYAEQRVQPVTDGCTTTGSCGGALGWGGATRIVAQPTLQFTDTYPAPRSGQIVLAQVALSSAGQVTEIVSGVRQYAVQAKPPTTRPISLEGEKDIDGNNPKTVYFHIDGTPNAVTLYLRAAQCSSLYYTELGSHSHADVLNAPNLSVPAHAHKLDDVATGSAQQDSANPVQLFAWSYDTDYNATTAVRLWGPSLSDPGLKNNQLTLPLQQGDQALVSFKNLSAHTHNLANGSVTGPDGAIDQSLGITFTPAAVGLQPPARTASTDAALTYVNALEVWYDGQDITSQIIAQIVSTDTTGTWKSNSTLGDGTSTNPLVVKSDGTGGTGAIALDQLGLDFSQGQHRLTFQVAANQSPANGGQIQYNLYVE